MVFLTSLFVTAVIIGALMFASDVPDRLLLPVALITFVAAVWLFHGDQPKSQL